MPEAKQITLKKQISVFCIAFAAMLCAALIWTHNRGSSIDDPVSSWNVDGIFYDNIAFNLAGGKGFVVDLNAEAWRSTYVAANQATETQGKYDWLMPVKGQGPTSLRSPSYPYVLASIYNCFGHRYDIARICGCLFIALGLALLLTFLATRWNVLAAVITAATLSIDYSVMQSAGTLATESLAILIFAITFLLVVRAWENPSTSNWIFAGFSFAALMLTRGIWSLGLLILICFAILTLIPVIHRSWESLRPSHLFTFLITAILFASPWWVRNCQTTGHFTPFGTAGSCGFAGAYCDESLNNYGQWQADVYNNNQIEVQKNFDMDTADLAQVEHAIGVASMQKAKAWCASNWKRLPELMSYRALCHWGMFNLSVPTIAQVANIWLVVIGLVGCCFFTGNLKRLFIVILILDTVLVMLTWEHLGRYAIPIRPIVHLGYGLLIAQFLIASTAKMRRTDQASD